jgi:hypothetical protein
MDEAHNHLLSRKLEAFAAELRADPGAAGEARWDELDRALAAAKADDPAIEDSDLGVIVATRSADELADLVARWRDGREPLPASDRAILKRAIKALKKRLKLTRLDDESRIGGDAMTAGRRSAIVAVRPPDQYPPEVWQLLKAQRRVRDEGGGLLSIVGDDRAD